MAERFSILYGKLCQFVSKKNCILCYHLFYSMWLNKQWSINYNAIYFSAKIEFDPPLPTVKKELLKRSFMANYVKVLITYQTVSSFLTDRNWHNFV